MVGTDGTRGDRGWGVQALDVGRGRAFALEEDAFTEALQGFFVRNALDLNPVGLGEFPPGVGHPVEDDGVIGEEHQPFAVHVQASCGVDARDGDEVREGGSALRVGELGEDAVWFVEEDVSGHGHCVHAVGGWATYMIKGLRERTKFVILGSVECAPVAQQDRAADF